MATGRSDYPNQVNNVIGFPFIFRGALDVRATQINEEMKLAAVRAIANLATTTSSRNGESWPTIRQIFFLGKIISFRNHWIPDL